MDDVLSTFVWLTPALLVGAMLVKGAWPIQRIPDGSFGVERIGDKKFANQIPHGQGQRGTQPRLLPSGARYNEWRRDVTIYDELVIPDGCLGLVTSHVGFDPMNATSIYKPEFGDFTDVEAFLAEGGEKGVQEAMLPPGTYAIHPLAFEVIVLHDVDTPNTTYGRKAEVTKELHVIAPSVVQSPAGPSVVVWADDNILHPTTTSLLVGEAYPYGHRIELLVASPFNAISIEWEAAVPLNDPEAEQRIIQRLQMLSVSAFHGTDGQVGLVEFLIALQELEEKARGVYCVRINEAVMLPRLAKATEPKM
jgi:hypothetical protein